jgi:hypothetical protein
MADSDIERQKLEDTLRSLRSRFGGFESVLRALQQSANQTMNATERAENNERLFSAVKKRGTQVLRDFSDAVRRGSMSSGDAEIAFRQMTKAIEMAAGKDEESQRAAQESIAALTQQYNQIKSLTNIMKRFDVGLGAASTTLGLVGGAAGGLIKSYQGGGSDISFAIEASKTGAEALSGAFKAGGNALEKFGKDLSGSGGKYKKYAEILGIGAKLAGGGIDLLQKGMAPLNAELENNYKSFMDISSSGAIFANGLKGMSDASAAVNLTMPQLADVIKQNADSLTQSGVGMTAALERMGKVGKVIKDTGLDAQMYRLGIGYKEQAGLMAEVMSTYAATGKLRGASEQQLAQTTSDYATNLKLLSSITGQDAKKAEEKNRRAGFQADVYAKLSESGPEAMKKFQDQLILFQQQDPSGKMADAYMAQVSGIQSADPGVRSLMEIPAVVEQLQTASNATLDPTIKLEDATSQTVTAMGKLREELTKPENLNWATRLAQAGRLGVNSAIVETINNVYGNMLAATNLTPEGVADAKANIEKQKKAQADETQALVDMASASQDAKISIQKAFVESEVLKWLAGLNIASANTAASAFNNIVSPIIGHQEPDNRTQARMEAIQNNIADLSSASASDPQQVMDNSRIIAQLQQELKDLQDSQRQTAGMNARGFARGGIVSGSTDGYSALLHGTEAVIPLPENMRDGQFADLLKELIDSTAAGLQPDSDIVRAMQFMGMDNNSSGKDFNAETLNAIEKLSNIMMSVLQATLDVANNTDKTARRIA